MKIQCFVCNPYQQNTYVAYRADQSACMIVDAGIYSPEEEHELTDFVQSHGLKVEAVLVTHAHPDHVCGLERLRALYPDARIVQYSEHKPTPGSLHVASFDVQVLHTPGHKEDCLCYYLPAEGVLFSGDTLFYGSVGRTDLPGGDMVELLQSLHELMQLPAATVVYPGHGESTTVAHEQQYNPYIRR